MSGVARAILVGGRSQLSPSLLAMTIMPSTTVIFLTKAGLRGATRSMTLFCCRRLIARLRVNILTAEFLTTFPAPRATTASIDMKLPTCFKTASKNIVTRGIF